MEVVNTIGRRKTAVARIYLKEGKGDITVNGRKFENYFTTEVLRIIVKQPLTLVDQVNNFDININVDGGGIAGQAEAVRHAISRALVEVSLDNKPAIKAEGFLTRDPRMVERKKYGRAKARKRFQFSKR